MRRCFLFVLFVLFGSFAVCAEKGKEIKPLEILDIDRLVRAVDKQLQKAETTRDKDQAIKRLYDTLKNRRVLIDPTRCKASTNHTGSHVIFEYKRPLLKKNSVHDATYLIVRFAVGGGLVTVDQKEKFLAVNLKCNSIVGDKYHTRLLNLELQGIEQ